MRQQTISLIKQKGIIAIIRGLSADDAVLAAKALQEGGISLVEVTFDAKQPDKAVETLDAIRRINELFQGSGAVGAGTVIKKEQVKMAAEAGAKYIISPTCDKEIIQYTRELGLVSIPGAFTPTEISDAYEFGADFVKLFPAGNLGPSYLKAIRAPLSHIPILVVGGVDLSNLGAFLQVGAAGAGIGGNLIDKKAIKEGKFDHITNIAASYVKIIEERRQEK